MTRFLENRWIKNVFVPCSLIYLDIVFHIYMGLSFEHWAIFLLFDLSFGFLLAILCNSFSDKTNKILTCFSTFALGLCFFVEMMLRAATACYYQYFSALHMLFENHVFDDYGSVVLKSVLSNLHGLVLMMAPFVLSVFIAKKSKSWEKIRKKLICAFTAVFVLGHFVAYTSLGLYDGLNELYKTDTEIEEKVESFGLITMLRLDAKFLIFGVDRDVSISTEELESIKDLQEEITSEVEYNVLDVEFDDSDNQSVNWLNNYYSHLTPSLKNEYTGMFEGYNVIFITAEGFSGYMIDEELTPTLYKLTHEGFVFNNFYTPLHYTSTTNGECQNLLSLYPKNGEPKVLDTIGKEQLYMPFTLANQLNNLGYNSIGYHFNKEMYNRRESHPILGYQWNDSEQLLLEQNKFGNDVWPQSDYYMIEQTIDEYINSENPFNIYYMTISGHMPYSYLGNDMTEKNWDEVNDLNYSDRTKAFIAANLELEKGLTLLINKLEEAGIADKTLIVMAPDHIPYFDIDIIEELAGKTFGESEQIEMLDEEGIDFEVYKNSLVIWSASMDEPVIVDKVCGQVDILPTLLNLLGVNYDSRFLAGTDILSSEEGLVVFNSKCWISDKGFYDRYTKTFTPNKGIIISEDYVSSMNTLINYKLKSTILIMETDYFRTLNIKPED